LIAITGLDVIFHVHCFQRVNMMSNTNYSIGLQRLKPIYTAYCGLHNLAENWSWVQDINGRDRDETEDVFLLRPRRWQFLSRQDRDETLVCLETKTSRPRCRDRDHNPVQCVNGTRPTWDEYSIESTDPPPRWIQSGSRWSTLRIHMTSKI